MNVALFAHARARELQRFLPLLFRTDGGRPSSVGRKILRRPSSKNDTPHMTSDLGRRDMRSKARVRVSAAAASQRRALRLRRRRSLAKRGSRESVRRCLRRRISLQRGVMWPRRDFTSALSQTTWLPSHRYLRARFHFTRSTCMLPYRLTGRDARVNVVPALVPLRSTLKQLHRAVRSVVGGSVVCDVSSFPVFQVRDTAAVRELLLGASTIGVSNSRAASVVIPHRGQGGVIPAWVAAGEADTLLLVLPDASVAQAAIDHVLVSGCTPTEVVALGPASPGAIAMSERSSVCPSASAAAAAQICGGLCALFEVCGALSQTHVETALKHFRNKQKSKSCTSLTLGGVRFELVVSCWTASSTVAPSAFVMLHIATRNVPAGANAENQDSISSRRFVANFARAAQRLFRVFVMRCGSLPIGHEERVALRAQLGLPSFQTEFALNPRLHLSAKSDLLCRAPPTVDASKLAPGFACLRFSEPRLSLHKRRGSFVFQLDRRRMTYRRIGVITSSTQSLFDGDRVAIALLSHVLDCDVPERETPQFIVSSVDAVELGLEVLGKLERRCGAPTLRCASVRQVDNVVVEQGPLF